MQRFLRSLSRKTLIISVLVLGVALVTGVGLAAAAAQGASAPNTALVAGETPTPTGQPTGQPTRMPGKHHLHLVQVTAVNGNNITVVPAREVVQKGAKQTPITLTISSDTKITKYGKAAQASAIQPDEFLVVRATDPQHVQQIDILGYGVRGTIQKISGSTLTLQTEQNKTMTVHVNSGAHIFVGHQPASLSDLRAKETVEALGDRNSDGSLNAMLVHVDLIHGQVKAINGNKITLSTGKNGTQTTTVTTNADTKYYAAGQPVPSTRLQQGDWIGVAGPGSQQAGVTATAIFIYGPATPGTPTPA